MKSVHLSITRSVRQTKDITLSIIDFPKRQNLLDISNLVSTRGNLHLGHVDSTTLNVHLPSPDAR